MAKKRVYELAKDLKTTSKDLMRLLEKLNIPIKSHMSTLEESDLKSINDFIEQRRRQVAARPQPPKPPVQRDIPDSRGDMAQPRHEGQTGQKPEGPSQDQRPVRDSMTRPEQAQGPAGGYQQRPQGDRPGGYQQRPQGQTGGYQPRPQGGPGGYQPRPQGGPGGYQPRPQGGPGGYQPRPQGGPGGYQPRPQGDQPGGYQQRPQGDRPGGSQQRPGQGQRPGGFSQQRPGQGQRPGGFSQQRPGGGRPGAAPAGDRPQRRRQGPGGIRQDADIQKKDSFGEGQEKFFARGKRRKTTNKSSHQPVHHQVKRITVGDTISVHELAVRLGRRPAELIKKLMDLGQMVTLNAELTSDVAIFLGSEFGTDVQVRDERPVTEIEDLKDATETLKDRPPVVTVMGHVDHGKTSLLDAVRKTKVTATEAGGITQHIGAYQVEIDGKKITFLDTPGHEAFTAMRARGAQATDIAVLVVAADDGVMPQTVEAINHCRAAKVPIVVAINKMDRPDANPDRVKQELAEHELVPEDWGGDVICVPVSAVNHEGIDHLLEMILLVSEVAELKANPDRAAKGTVVESRLDKGRGPVATVLVQKGTLRVGDNLVLGATYGRVRAMIDYQGNKLQEAPPSMPVEVQGLSELPLAGDTFQVVDEEKIARLVASNRQDERRELEMSQSNRVNPQDILKRMDQEETRELNVILKADVHGSAEAIRQALTKLGNEEVRVNVLHSGVGALSETDVMLAAASKAIIVGFNVRPDTTVRRAAENEGVDIRLYQVIYELVDDIKSSLGGLLQPDVKEVVLGRASVRAVFRVPRAGAVAGSYVTDGKIVNHTRIRVLRDAVVVHDGRIGSLRRFKDDVREVAQGYECGIGLEKFNDIKEGDVLEAYEMQEVRRELQ